MSKYDSRDWFDEPKCSVCRDSGWWYPTEHAVKTNTVIRCPRCYPSDDMRRAHDIPDRTGERP